MGWWEDSIQKIRVRKSQIFKEKSLHDSNNEKSSPFLILSCRLFLLNLLH